MAAVRKHWREASTLILVTARQRDNFIKPNFVKSSAAPSATKRFPEQKEKGDNFEVLLLKRSAKSSFMPNVYVFPGGVASDIDFSADWIPIFDTLGKDFRQKLFDFVQRGGQGPPMFSRPRDQQFSSIPSEIAFRLCAIRETFEESGVLIASRPKGKNSEPFVQLERGTWGHFIQDEAPLKQWRNRVNEDPREFLHMCQELGAVPNVWALYEWSNWLTPLGSRQRFDTAFFICCVENKPHVAEDEKETVHSQWASPFQTLQEYYQSRVDLAPPQVYELDRLTQFASVPDILTCASYRREHRAEQWLPVKVVLSDCIMTALAGDSLFPEFVDAEGPPVAVTHNQTLAQMDGAHPPDAKHRLLFLPDTTRPNGRVHCHRVCTITLPGEQAGWSSVSRL